MHLIVGLGNPGPRYEGSRHNMGYRVIEALAGSLHAQRPRQKFRALYAGAWVGQEQVILAQPLTYMNRSGLAVAELLRFYSLDPEQLILIYDELDLPPGVIRIRRGGGSAGHRGLQSVIELLKSADFTRVRLGIGKPEHGVETADYVLQRPSAGESELLGKAVCRAAEAVEALVRRGLSAAMNQFNSSNSGKPLQNNE